MGLKQWWKNRPYWKKGGIIGFLFTLFFYLIYGVMFLIPNLMITQKIAGIILLFHIYFMDLYTPFVDKFINTTEPGWSAIFLSVYITPFLFIIIGIFIGFIVGKLKNEKLAKKK